MSTADARVTILASIPPTARLDGPHSLPDKCNGLAGLGTALASVGWSAEAADATVTALAGSLGDPSNAEWVAELAIAMTGNGAHGQLTLTGQDPGLRILYPTNFTAFAYVHACGVVSGVVASCCQQNSICAPYAT